jgi:hypothetical protein
MVNDVGGKRPIQKRSIQGTDGQARLPVLVKLPSQHPARKSIQ